MGYAKFSLLVLMTIALSSFALAQIETFEASVSVVENQIIVNESASFDVTIKNSYSDPREFKILKSGYPFWDMFVQPLSNPITVRLEPDEQQTIRLYVKPLHVTNTGTYNVDTEVEDLRSGRKQLIPIRVTIVSTDPLIGGYVPTVLASLRMEDELDPREDNQFTITFNNQNVLDYPDLMVRVNSNLVNGEYHYALGPKAEKTVTIPLELDPSTPPQTDKLVVAVFRDNRSILNPLVKEFEISEYSEKTETEPHGQFLKTKRTISIHSNNPDYEGLIKAPTTSYSQLFTTTSPKATLAKEDDQEYFMWSVDLDENNQMHITITENYRPIVIIIVVILILIGMYFIFRSPLVITKEVSSLKKKEGGVNAIKVILKLRNRGSESLHEIEVADVIPRIAQVHKELSIGTLHPQKVVRSHKKGTILKWVVDTLDSNEGVVLSYKMKSKLSILGEFSLPSATARFKRNNNYVITNSNRVTVNS